MKKVLSLVLVLCMMLALAPSAMAEQSYDVSLNGKWDFKYYANTGEVPEDVEKIVFEEKIQVPGAMELQGFGYPSYFYEEMGGWGQPEDDGVRSTGVYKTSFKYNGEGYLVFENVEDSLTVYLNGEKLIESKLGEIGTAVQFEGKGNNEIICVVERNNSGINKKDDFSLSGFMGDVYVTKSITIEKSGRNIEVKDNKLFIDGKETVLKGVKYTPAYPEGGSYITEEQIDRDLQLIKEYGFNSVWTSCAPDYFYEKAEEAGLYVIDEANVNLASADRDMETAKRRVEEMVEKHFGFKSIIMWSVGFGAGGQNLIKSVKELDERPVAQEVNFAEDFKVFGNTGGMADWVEILGKGNVGGFVDEFSDKELYYTQSSYLFETKDLITGEKITVDGEIENYKGMQYFGDGEFVRNIEKMDKYTIVTEIAPVNGDRVIFENGNVKFEIRGGRARFSVGDKRARADVYEGKIAAVYMDGEIQLFVNNAFAENAQTEAPIEGDYKIGGGDTPVGYIEIYNDALTLEELLEGADVSKLVSRVQFDDIDIKEDKSYEFLAYGGDFGDNPSSYYKCLTGIFSSTREPHPEAEAFKALLTKVEREELVYSFDMDNVADKIEPIAPIKTENGFVFKANENEFTIDYEGKIASIKLNGTEYLTKPMELSFVRENTLNEYEMGVESEQWWNAVKTEVKDDKLYVKYKSHDKEGVATVEYAVTLYGVMSVSVQAEFSDNALMPTFIGFRGAGDFDKVEWYGYKQSSYPDRKAMDAGVFEKPVSEMGDNYAVPQENGNKEVVDFGLINENGGVTFKSASQKDNLWVQALDYSSEAMEKADHDEDVWKDGNTYFRVGGFIKGLSDDSEYALNENIYGYKFFIGINANMVRMDEVREIYVDQEELTAFAPHIKTYVYQTNKTVEIKDAIQDGNKAIIGDYTVYFAPDTEYLSDMTPSEITAEIATDSDFDGNKITLRGNNWEMGTTYDKGIGLKNGSVTYDVSGFNNHVFNAVIGKADFDWRKMEMGFDRNMFSASANVTISLDGVVVEEVKDVSMRGGSREVSIDVSNAKKLTIEVKGSGRAPAFEDAILANSAFVPNGPVVVNYEKKDGKATITVLNTDENRVDVVLTATENGTVTTEAASICKGLYRTVEIKAGDNATIKAYVTGVGEIVLQ